MLADTIEIKNKITGFLKANQNQFYFLPDTTSPLKVVFRGFRSRNKPEEILSTLGAESMEFIKCVLMANRKDGIISPLFLLSLPSNDDSRRIFKLKALYHIRVEIQNYRPPKKGDTGL